MNECGCAPPDVFSFGVEPPDPDLGWTPCLTEDDCPWLCSDAGVDKAKDLCYAFDGIAWFEGSNPVQFDMFQNSEGFNESVTQITLADE